MSAHIVTHTSLRGLAALSVFWGHYTDVFARDVAGVNLFVPHTHLGVDLFFVLSGFVLYHAYADYFVTGPTLRRWGLFLRQRLLRIYPLHLVTMLAAIVLARFTMPDHWQEQVLLNLTLTQAWGMADTFVFNAPSWSISAEFAAYLLFPLAAVATVTALGRWGLVALAGLAAALAIYWGGGSLDLAEIGRNHALVRVAIGFPIGVLLGWFVASSAPLEPGRAGLLQVAVIGLGAAVLALGLSELWMIPAFALLVYATANDQGPLARIAGWAPLYGLGLVSYGVYLLQWPVMVFMFNLDPWIAPYLSGLWMDAGRLLLVICLVLGMASLSWRWFEAPLARIGRKAIAASRQPGR